MDKSQITLLLLLLMHLGRLDALPAPPPSVLALCDYIVRSSIDGEYSYGVDEVNVDAVVVDTTQAALLDFCEDPGLFRTTICLLPGIHKDYVDTTNMMYCRDKEVTLQGLLSVAGEGNDLSMPSTYSDLQLGLPAVVQSSYLLTMNGIVVRGISFLAVAGPNCTQAICVSPTAGSRVPHIRFEGLQIQNGAIKVYLYLIASSASPTLVQVVACNISNVDNPFYWSLPNPGAFYVYTTTYSNVSVVGSLFSNNGITSISVDQYPYSAYPTVTIEKSVFEKNTAGILQNKYSASIQSSLIQDNTLTDLQAVVVMSVYHDQGGVRDSVFRRNTIRLTKPNDNPQYSRCLTPYAAQVLYPLSSSMPINDCSFLDNYCVDGNGGMFDGEEYCLVPFTGAVSVTGDIKQRPKPYCPLGQGLVNSYTCAPCSHGSYSEGGYSCTTCPAGTYQNLSGQTNCTLCNAGYTSTDGAESCSSCAPGTFAANSGSPQCYECPKNTYQPSSGGTYCSSCPHGTSSPPGSSSCS